MKNYKILNYTEVNSYCVKARFEVKGFKASEIVVMELVNEFQGYFGYAVKAEGCQLEYREGKRIIDLLFDGGYLQSPLSKYEG